MSFRFSAIFIIAVVLPQPGVPVNKILTGVGDIMIYVYSGFVVKPFF